MATTLPNPTRMELTRLKRKLTTALRGHKLLKDKRDELMRQFLDLVRENKALRERVEAGLAQCNQNFVLARAGMSDEELNTAMMAPKQEVLLEADSRNVMSVPGLRLRGSGVLSRRYGCLPEPQAGGLCLCQSGRGQPRAGGRLHHGHRRLSRRADRGHSGVHQCRLCKPL